MLRITAHENGPFVLEGHARYEGADRIPHETGGDAIALCRCGRTAAGPLCDGTHRKVGFRAAEYELSVETPATATGALTGG